MADGKKRFELIPVDESAPNETPVIRLQSENAPQRAQPVRLEMSPADMKISKRLEIPEREDFEIRTHQPGIDALLETVTINPDFLEEEWGKDSTGHHNIPWGWFVLVAMILAGAVLWSLTGVKKADAQAHKIRVTTESVLGNDAKADQEAGKLIDRIEATTREFFDSTSIDSAVRFVRQPDRVRPLMERYYAGLLIPNSRHFKTKLLQPITLDNRANFWMTSVELANHQTRNLIIEIDANGEPRIDWETLVCYQPMNWDSFAIKRPAGSSLDFRVYIEPDNFFSHEFSDPDQWNCFRLTALDSDETLFGYAKVNEEVSQELLSLLKQNQGHKTSIIVRVNIPEGLQSRRGVVIEKLISPRWLYLDPPQ